MNVCQTGVYAYSIQRTRTSGDTGPLPHGGWLRCQRSVHGLVLVPVIFSSGQSEAPVVSIPPWFQPRSSFCHTNGLLGCLLFENVSFQSICCILEVEFRMARSRQVYSSRHSSVVNNNVCTVTVVHGSHTRFEPPSTLYITSHRLFRSFSQRMYELVKKHKARRLRQVRRCCPFQALKVFLRASGGEDKALTPYEFFITRMHERASSSSFSG